MGTLDLGEHTRRKFYTVFERIRGDIIDHLKQTVPSGVVEWYSSNLDFNAAGGKLEHSMQVVDLVKILRGRTLSDDEYFKAAVLGWCVKLLQVSRLCVYEDDEPHKHRDQHCWHAGDDIVIKDTLWLHMTIYFLLKKYFRAEKYYVHLLELFHDMTFQFEMSQSVNLITASHDRTDSDTSTPHPHAPLARSEAARFYLQLGIAMRVCDVPESYTVRGCRFFPYATARSILARLGEYVQVQKDFLNDVGNKCSCCIHAVLVVSSPEQRTDLEEMWMKEIYETIRLREWHRMCEANLRERIEESIAIMPEPEGNAEGGVLKREVFSIFLNEIYESTDCVRSGSG